jgi:hypothetical protein
MLPLLPDDSRWSVSFAAMESGISKGPPRTACCIFTLGFLQRRASQKPRRILRWSIYFNHEFYNDLLSIAN